MPNDNQEGTDASSAFARDLPQRGSMDAMGGRGGPCCRHMAPHSALSPHLARCIDDELLLESPRGAVVKSAPEPRLPLRPNLKTAARRPRRAYVTRESRITRAARGAVSQTTAVMNQAAHAQRT